MKGFTFGNLYAGHVDLFARQPFEVFGGKVFPTTPRFRQARKSWPRSKNINRPSKYCVCFSSGVLNVIKGHRADGQNGARVLFIIGTRAYSERETSVNKGSLWGLDFLRPCSFFRRTGVFDTLSKISDHPIQVLQSATFG